MPLLASGIFQFYSIFLGTLLDAFGIYRLGLVQRVCRYVFLPGLKSNFEELSA